MTKMLTFFVILCTRRCRRNIIWDNRKSRNHGSHRSCHFRQLPWLPWVLLNAVILPSSHRIWILFRLYRLWWVLAKLYLQF